MIAGETLVDQLLGAQLQQFDAASKDGLQRRAGQVREDTLAVVAKIAGETSIQVSLEYVSRLTPGDQRHI